MRRHKLTEEEKVATRLANIINDLTIDLEQVGVYFARSSRLVSQNRLQVVAEAAQAERDNLDNGTIQYTLW